MGHLQRKGRVSLQSHSVATHCNRQNVLPSFFGTSIRLTGHFFLTGTLPCRRTVSTYLHSCGRFVTMSLIGMGREPTRICLPNCVREISQIVTFSAYRRRREGERVFGFVKTLDSGRGRVIEHDAFLLINWTLHLLPQTQIKWSFGTHQPNQPNQPLPAAERK